jgi:hypothetical protein
LAREFQNSKSLRPELWRVQLEKKSGAMKNPANQILADLAGRGRNREEAVVKGEIMHAGNGLSSRNR